MSSRAKRARYLRLWPTVLVCAFATCAFLPGARGGWIEYWLVQDGRPGVALVTDLSTGPTDWTRWIENSPRQHRFGYLYSVDGRNYRGTCPRNSNPERSPVPFDVTVGQKLTVYYSESHPWLSSLYPPKGLFDAYEWMVFPFVFASVGVGCAGWLVLRILRRGWATRLGVDLDAGTGHHSLPKHVARHEWQLRLETIKSTDLPDDERETETFSVGSATVYQLTGADGHNRTYHSLAEMPPRLRAWAERALKEARAAGADSEENSARFETSKEMRQRLEEFASHPKPARRFALHFRGPDGHEHTYHSLEELPPHVCEIYQRFMNHKFQSGPDGPTDC